jgi:DnaJ-domain-containing protein 1
VTDYFALLNEPRRPWLEADSLKSKFLTLSAEVHPDRTHQAAAGDQRAANQAYTELNAAYNCLREPRSRIRHLLELELGHKPSDLTNVPDDLLDLFFQIGKVFRDVDALLVEKAKATSPMLQVQFFERGQDWVERLGLVRGQISARREALLEELKTVDAVWEVAASLASPKGGEGRGEEALLAQVQIPSPQPSPRSGGEREMIPVSSRHQRKPTDRLLEIWRLLSFYDRWLAQIQERVVQLSF